MLCVLAIDERVKHSICHTPYVSQGQVHAQEVMVGGQGTSMTVRYFYDMLRHN